VVARLAMQPSGTPVIWLAFVGCRRDAIAPSQRTCQAENDQERERDGAVESSIDGFIRAQQDPTRVAGLTWSARSDRIGATRKKERGNLE